MFRNRRSHEESNFWISYADLMAGLLFVFILLIGAIVSKSIILKSDLNEKKRHLNLLSQTLRHKENSLEKLREQLRRSRLRLTQREAALVDTNRSLQNVTRTLALREDEIVRLRRLLSETNATKEALKHKLLIVNDLLKETNATLVHERKHYDDEIALLAGRIDELNATLHAKEDLLAKANNALDASRNDYTALLEKLRRQKARIKALTGIRLKVIEALKKHLKDRITVDKKSGSLRLASNVLFDKGSATLKEEAKATLKTSFEEYIGALMADKEIRPYLDKIVIEGHTDSDGGYLYNLDLSQRRAYAVMRYLLSLDFAKRYNLKPLLVASGRAYLDPILKNGVEDKEASRRIEIKFRLKNEDAMHEIERILDAE